MAEVSDNVFRAEELAFSIQDLQFMLSRTVVPSSRVQGVLQVLSHGIRILSCVVRLEVRIHFPVGPSNPQLLPFVLMFT